MAGFKETLISAIDVSDLRPLRRRLAKLRINRLSSEQISELEQDVADEAVLASVASSDWVTSENRDWESFGKFLATILPLILEIIGAMS